MKTLEIKLFISSTFDNCMAEVRNSLRNEMLAKMNAIAGQIQGNVYLNDFELGIPEGTDGLSVLEICLDTIVKSDYFLGIMGEQNGTKVVEILGDSKCEKSVYRSLLIESVEKDLTVLEMEFLCAIRYNIKSYFYMNSQCKVNNYEESIIKQLIDNNKRITGYTGLEQLKKIVIEDMEKEWNLSYELFSKYSKDEKDINIIIANKIRYYVPNEECLKSIDNYIASNVLKVFWIDGAKSSGKSTILFDWYNTNIGLEEYNLLFFSSDYISLSLDEFLYEIIYNLQQVEQEDYIGGYNLLNSDLERIEYFHIILKEVKDLYILLIDGLEHFISHAAINPMCILPEVLESNVKIISTSCVRHSGAEQYFFINKFDMEKFTKTFFEREGKILIYNHYKEEILKILQVQWTPASARLVLSYIIITAKYNSIDLVIKNFKEKLKKNDNAYISYIILMNEYFKEKNEREPLKDSLLLLYFSRNGIRLSSLALEINASNKINEIFNTIYFWLAKTSYGRYALRDQSIRKSLEDIYANEMEEYRLRFLKMLLCEIEMYKDRIDETFDLWEDYLYNLVSFEDSETLKLIFLDKLNVIANLWYYNRELLIQSFEIIKGRQFVEQLITQACMYYDTNAPYFVSHLLYEYGYYREAIYIYENIYFNKERSCISENDMATVYNNWGVCIMEFCDENNRKKGKEYLLKGYSYRKNRIDESPKELYESCNNLFLYYLDIDREEAELYLKEAIKICEMKFEKNSRESMQGYINQAFFHESSDENQALEFYNQALKVSNYIFSEDSLESAKINQLKGVLYSNAGEYNLALECGYRSARVYESKGIYNDDCCKIFKMLGDCSLKMEQQGLSKELAQTSSYWYRKTLIILKEYDSNEYLENLKSLKDYYTDLPKTYWEIL